jgi:hypothetical protein
VDLSDDFEGLEYIENMRTYQKLKTEQDQQKPKLYATILKYLSDKSLDAIQKVPDWTEIEESVDPECLRKAVKDKFRVHSTSKVAGVIKLEARNQLQKFETRRFQEHYIVQTTVQ